MTLSFSISKQLENLTVNVDAVCDTGTLTAIVGPSGSGKTTLIRMLAGLETPDSGTIQCDNTVWYSPKDNITVRPQHRHVGMVFQDYTLFPHLTVEKNIRFAAVHPDKVPDLLHNFGIEHIRHKKPCCISGGERQRAAFCQALAREPVALLLDEPFSALDVTTRRKLQELLLAIKKELQIPIIHVTHDLEEAALLGDTIIAMEHGQLSPDWLTNQLMAAKKVSETTLQKTCTQVPHTSLSQPATIHGKENAGIR